MRRLLSLLLVAALAAPAFARPGGEDAPDARDPDQIVERRAERQRRYEEAKAKRAELQKEFEASLPTGTEALPGFTDAATGRIPSPAEAARPDSPADADPAPAAAAGSPAVRRGLERRDRLLIGLIAALVFLVTLRAFLIRLPLRRKVAPEPASSTMTVSLRPIEERRLGR